MIFGQGCIFVRMCKVLGWCGGGGGGVVCRGGKCTGGCYTGVWLAWPETAGLLPARLREEEEADK